MHHEISCEWKGDMMFETSVMGHTIMLDKDQGDGMPTMGPLPKPLILVAVAGCTGMDVVPMLKKMHVPVEGLAIKVVGDVAETHPKVYTQIKIVYEFSGDDLEAYRTQIERAVTLSQEKYCSVSAMLRPSVEITTQIRILSEELAMA